MLSLDTQHCRNLVNKNIHFPVGRIPKRISCKASVFQFFLEVHHHKAMTYNEYVVGVVREQVIYKCLEVIFEVLYDKMTAKRLGAHYQSPNQ